MDTRCKQSQSPVQTGNSHTTRTRTSAHSSRMGGSPPPRPLVWLWHQSQQEASHGKRPYRTMRDPILGISGPSPCIPTIFLAQLSVFPTRLTWLCSGHSQKLHKLMTSTRDSQSEFHVSETLINGSQGRFCHGPGQPYNFTASLHTAHMQANAISCFGFFFLLVRSFAMYFQHQCVHSKVAGKSIYRKKGQPSMKDKLSIVDGPQYKKLLLHSARRDASHLI